MDPTEQSMATKTIQLFYPAERVWNGCTLEPNTQLLADPRFTPSGLYTTLNEMQRESNVDKVIAGSPHADRYLFDDEVPIQSWNRPTLQWDLQCEKEGLTREWAMQAVIGSI